MTDQQLLTLALAVIIPLSLLLYSNSRITDAKETLRADIQSLRSDVRAEMGTMRAEMGGFKSEIIAAIRELDTKIENGLMIHELEHHHK